MGVNMVGFAITDDEAAKEASKQEIIRRYYQTVLDFKNERVPETAVKKIELLMNDLGITPEDRQVVVAARAKAEETGGSALASNCQMDKSSLVKIRTLWSNCGCFDQCYQDFCRY